jgi:hypothetical protein
LPWYGLGCLLIWAAAAFGAYEALTTVVTLRVIVALGFGVYAGIRDGQATDRFWRFHIVGLIAGIGAATAAALVSLGVSKEPVGVLLGPNNIFAISTILVSTWLLFVSGVLFGMGLQLWLGAGAEVSAHRVNSGQASGQRRSVKDWGVREQVLFGCVTTLLAALINLTGTLVGN